MKSKIVILGLFLVSILISTSILSGCSKKELFFFRSPVKYQREDKELIDLEWDDINNKLDKDCKYVCAAKCAELNMEYFDGSSATWDNSLGSTGWWECNCGCWH